MNVHASSPNRWGYQTIFRITQWCYHSMTFRYVSKFFVSNKKRWALSSLNLFKQAISQRSRSSFSNFVRSLKNLAFCWYLTK